MRQTFKYWLEASRLRTLPVSLSGVLAAWAAALADGCFRWPEAVLCLLFALLCQTASNYANEYYDYLAGRDRRGREGPRRGVTEGEISPSAMKHATFGVLAAAALVGLGLLLLTGKLWLLLAGAFIGLGALAYSTGPYPLSTHCLGEVAVFFFFGIIPVNLTYYVQSLTFTLPVLMLSCAIGLMGANVLIVNNYRDIPDDCAVGKHTLATRFGRRAMLILYWVNALAATALAVPMWTRLPMAWLVVPALYLVAAALIVRLMARRTGASLTPCLGMTAVSMAFFSLMLLIAMLF